MGSLIGKKLGGLFDSNEKQLNRLQSWVARINELEPEFQRRTDDELRETTDSLRNQLSSGAELDEVLSEAFAAVREASRRTIGLRHFDAQLLGGIVLHQGRIAEMKTGEGKTLVATLPLYLNALRNQGAHLVTVNDYLAKRDCLWMGPIYHTLGLSVACITGRQDDLNMQPSFMYDPEYEDPAGRWSRLRPISRQDAYRAHITYGTNNEFGFDYLRDNMVTDPGQCVQRSLSYAIVDEVDNILIDEARTPLIVSAPSEEAANLYILLDRIVAALARDKDYNIDERTRTVHLTDDVGIPRVEGMLRSQGLLKGPNLFDRSNYSLTFYLQSALRAHALFRRDKDYVVKNGQVIIVDEHTGRLMPGRRYSEGLHQALEAKEHVQVQRESVTHATVTFQNFFRMYGKLAGMTGTALTEAEEFNRIYKLDVVEIPTHRPMIRQDQPDRVYRDESSKLKAVAREVKALHESGRPVLVGSTSIELSEVISDIFLRNGVRAQVLNAKNHEREAAIVAEAGRLGAVTVATNMAGRGVDIILGGTVEGRDTDEWQREHDKVVSLGGLAVVGTEHHEARRIDNQLRGRAGRQGDPGSTVFFVSLDDEIMRRFGGDRVKSVMQWAGMDEETPIEHPMVTKALANAQVQTEGYHFDIRKHLVEYDDVLNKHREVIYAERRKVIASTDLKENILSMLSDELRQIVSNRVDENLGEVDREGLSQDVLALMPMMTEQVATLLDRLPPGDMLEEMVSRVTGLGVAAYEQREQELGAQQMRLAERFIMLHVIDRLWMEHLMAMEYMRQGIGLRAVAQQQPLVVYKKEGHALFQGMLDAIKHDVPAMMFRVSVKTQQPGIRPVRPQPAPLPRTGETAAAGKKVGRNDPCPCGSGKKYKHCCGK
ncbi:MAG: preprotein translocase subunit SecA [Dehalococcoidia bacterium]|nr:preprotein translocase subunit SecA [Dehalococcoidia bacterium]